MNEPLKLVKGTTKRSLIQKGTCHIARAVYAAGLFIHCAMLEPNQPRIAASLAGVPAEIKITQRPLTPRQLG